MIEARLKEKAIFKNCEATCKRTTANAASGVASGFNSGCTCDGLFLTYKNKREWYDPRVGSMNATCTDDFDSGGMIGLKIAPKLT